VGQEINEAAAGGPQAVKEASMSRAFPAVFCAAILVANPVLAADVPLKDVAFVRDGLIAAAIAYEIGDKCDDLNARMLRGVAFLNSLTDHARDLGYSQAEIDAYIDDRAEKDRLEAIARQTLTAMGGVEGQWETYCSVGEAEIAADTQIGRLLR